MKKINFITFTLICTFYFCILGILLLYWLIGKSYITYAILLCILIVILTTRKLERKYTNIIYLFSLLLTIICFNLLIPVNRPYLYSALFSSTLFPLLVPIYLICIKQNTNLSNKIIKSLFWIFNIYCFINFFIMLEQINVKGFMVHNRSKNNLYLDMITGLVGQNGTHKLTFLFISTIYLDYYYLINKKGILKKVATFFLIFNIFSSIYISTFNDNRTFYFILPFSLFPILYVNLFYGRVSKTIGIKKKTIIKILLSICCLILSFFIFYKTNIAFKKFVDKSIVEQYFERTIKKFNESSSSTGQGEERIELLKYSLKNTNLLIGKGIGTIHMISDATVPKHFGLNDVNIRIYTGGIFFEIVILLIYIQFYKYFFKNTNFFNIFIVIFVIICSFYTQAFSQIDKTFYITLSMFIMSFCINNKMEEKNEKNRNNYFIRK